jgi:hypothetical protein
MRPTSDKEDTIRYNKERKATEFFIDRNGNVKRYKGKLSSEIISMHYRIANELFPELKTPDDYVMELGWVMVGSSVYNCPVIHKKPTDKQVKTLEKLKLFDRLIFPYKGDSPRLQRMMPNYKKYGALCPE